VHFGIEPTRTDTPGGRFGDREIREAASGAKIDAIVEQ
jgi:hypothetical protein